LVIKGKRAILRTSGAENTEGVLGYYQYYAPLVLSIIQSIDGCYFYPFTFLKLEKKNKGINFARFGLVITSK
jgi:hypothetical protein